MASKRMFSNSVIDSDSFCMLSVEAQLLYFHLGMKADNDGFVPVMKILKILGFDESPLLELEKAGFLFRFDGGVVVIVHWWVNNTYKADRYHVSRYTSLKNMLTKTENNEYSIMEPEWNQSGTDSEASIAQVSLAQGSLEKVIPAQGSTGEGSPEGGGDIQKVIEAAERHGIRINQSVIDVLKEELLKSSCEEVNSKIIREPNFWKRLELLGGTA
ncbi:MAG: hypothetical protein K5919_00900 [Clostridiales bacterium]|nr:hypothetical protein [Clostridiales bacterium]